MEGEALIWFIVGLALVLSEFFLPGVILVFFGIAAMVVAALIHVGLIGSLGVALIVFSVLSLALLFTLRRFFKDMFVGRSRDAHSGEGEVDADEFIGKTAVVLDAMDGRGGSGKIEFKGADWKAISSDPLSPGDDAEIVSRDGLTVHVRARMPR